MNEAHTAIIMIAIFCSIGVILPVFLMIRDDKNPQSALPNKLILWITMVFLMILIFGIVVDFQNLSETIRGDIIQYGFIALMLFGAIFGIDQLLKSKYIKTVKWKDLTVETQMVSRGEATGGVTGEQGKLESGSENEPETGNVNVEEHIDDET